MKQPKHRATGQYFPSKRDWWLGILIWAPAIGVIPLLLLSSPDEAWTTLAIAIPIYAFIAWLWFGTGYTVGPEHLSVRSGPLRWRIKLADITRIKETRNPLSSAALSLDRLEIRYAKFGTVLISPQDKNRFIDLMVEACPAVEVVLKKH